jgi:methyltransferase-like protein
MTDLTQRIAGTYDEMPYDSACYQVSSPDNLRTVAHLFGLDAPPLEHARVLELGCAAGGNLIPFAVRHPHAELVGIELSSVQVDDGQRIIAAMGLDNVRLLQGSITDVDAGLGKFDYILCHGVYSWVPEDVRAAILRISREHLSPQGVAYISYNTYPGWKAKEVVRDAMLLRGGNRANSIEKLSYARGMIDFLHEMAPKGSMLAKIMDDSIETIRNFPPYYLVHEYLEPCNAPCYFREFLDAARQEGLEFLGEAAAYQMFASNFGSHVAALLHNESGGEQTMLEQLIDFLGNRTFRQTLLVHADRADQIRYKLDPARIARLHVAGEYTAGPDDTWSTRGGTAFIASQPFNQAALTAISAAWPGTVPVSDLLQSVDGEESKQALLKFLGELIAANLIRIRLDPVRVGAAADPTPQVRAPSRRLAEQQDSTTIAPFNEWHEAVPRPDISTALLIPLMDGSRGREALSRALLEAVHQGSLKLERHGNTLVDPAEIESAAREATQHVVDWLARNAMLVPSDRPG